LGYRPCTAIATFNDDSAAELKYSMFHHREDVSGRGIGFVFFLEARTLAGQSISSMRIESDEGAHIIYPTPDALMLTGAELVEHLHPTLIGGEDGSHRRKMQELLFDERASEVAAGFVDFYGYHAAAGGWFFCGWVTLGWRDGEAPENVVVSFQEGDVGGEAFAALYPRQDLRDGGEGIVFFVRGPVTPLGSLCSVTFDAGMIKATLYAASTAPRLREGELLGRLRPVIGQAGTGTHRDTLLGMLSRRPYTGEDTLASLDAAIFLEIDEAILCGTDGLVLLGWCLAKPGDIHGMRVRSGPLIASFDLHDGIRLNRPDVMEALAGRGFDDPRCGFIVFVPHAVAPDGKLYIEVETRSREVGYRNVPRVKLEGITAIKRLLAAVDVRFDEVQHAFDRVLGPAVEGLNERRLAVKPEVHIVDYGNVATAARFSVIVPLFGRLDFVEYQMALYSAYARCAEIEFIYVLDDPPRRREAQFLFASVYERFQVPFRAVLLDRNVGFAPANNIGLKQARGRYVAFLNSDVFPGTLDWLERLAERLTSDPTLGVVGPVLLFEDGSVQHRGMHFQRLPEFGNWFFGMHHGKGMRAPGTDGTMQRCLSITGACMLMRRSLAEGIGGFDEIYAIGDFEDSDLCLKLRDLGLAAAVDPHVHLFHLERKSQAGSELGWRMNLTLYNAWQHQRRWGEAIAAHQGA
jgi:GT2 family glycosyltransferase